MHDRNIDFALVEQQIEPRTVIADYDNLDIILDAPAPAVKGHDHRAFVGVIAKGHAPALAPKIFAGFDARTRRNLLGAARDSGSQYHGIAAVAVVGEQQFRADGVGELCLARNHRLQRIGMPVIEDELGLKAILAEIAAFERREHWGHAGPAMRHGNLDPVQLHFLDFLS